MLSNQILNKKTDPCATNKSYNNYTWNNIDEDIKTKKYIFIIFLKKFQCRMESKCLFLISSSDKTNRNFVRFKSGKRIENHANPQLFNRIQLSLLIFSVYSVILWCCSPFYCAYFSVYYLLAVLVFTYFKRCRTACACDGVSWWSIYTLRILL